MTLATSPNVMARLFAGQYHRVIAFSIRLCPDVVFVAQTFGASSTKHVVQLTVGRLIVYKQLLLGIHLNYRIAVNLSTELVAGCIHTEVNQ